MKMEQKKHYNEEGTQKLIEAFNLKSNTLEGALEVIGTESDVLAKRLGPEIQKRLIGNCSDKWYGLCTLVGGLSTLIPGFYPLYRILNPTDSFDVECGFISAIGAALPGMMPGMFLGSYLDKKFGERDLKRLKKEYPSKVKDIEHMVELKAQYDALIIVSSPPIG